MNTAPGGDAMTVRFNRDAEIAALETDAGAVAQSVADPPGRRGQVRGRGEAWRNEARPPPGRDRHLAVLEVDRGSDPCCPSTLCARARSRVRRAPRHRDRAAPDESGMGCAP